MRATVCRSRSAATSWWVGAEAEAVTPPLHCFLRDAESNRTRTIWVSGPHGFLRHEELRGEDVRLALPDAVGGGREIPVAAHHRLRRSLQALADPVAELVRDREPLPRLDLLRVHEDHALGREEHPAAVADRDPLDREADEVLGDCLDGHGELVAAERLDVAPP